MQGVLPLSAIWTLRRNLANVLLCLPLGTIASRLHRRSRQSPAMVHSSYLITLACTILPTRPSASDGLLRSRLDHNQHDVQAIQAATADAQACGGRMARLSLRACSFSQRPSKCTRGRKQHPIVIRRLTELVRRMSAVPGQRSIVFVSPGSGHFDLPVRLLEVIDKATRANVSLTRSTTWALTVDVAAISAGLRQGFQLECRARTRYTIQNNRFNRMRWRISPAAPEALLSK